MKNFNVEAPYKAKTETPHVPKPRTLKFYQEKVTCSNCKRVMFLGGEERYKLYTLRIAIVKDCPKCGHKHNFTL